jgi:hypothetical protein
METVRFLLQIEFTFRRYCLKRGFDRFFLNFPGKLDEKSGKLQKNYNFIKNNRIIKWQLNRMHNFPSRSLLRTSVAGTRLSVHEHP